MRALSGAEAQPGADRSILLPFPGAYILPFAAPREQPPEPPRDPEPGLQALRRPARTAAAGLARPGVAA